MIPQYTPFRTYTGNDGTVIKLMAPMHYYKGGKPGDLTAEEIIETWSIAPLLEAFPPKKDLTSDLINNVGFEGWQTAIKTQNSGNESFFAAARVLCFFRKAMSAVKFAERQRCGQLTLRKPGRQYMPSNWFYVTVHSLRYQTAQEEIAWLNSRVGPEGWMTIHTGLDDVFGICDSNIAMLFKAKFA